MPLPLIVWGLAALAASWAAGEAAKDVGSGKYDAGRKLLAEVEKEIAAKQLEYINIRRDYLERLQSYSQLIYAAFSEKSYKVSPTSKILPKDLQELWDQILTTLAASKPDSSKIPSLKNADPGQVMRHSIHISRSHPSVALIGFFAAGIISAAQGAEKLFDGVKFLNHAKGEAEKARQSADRAIAAMRAQLADLDIKWNTVVCSMIATAKDNPSKAGALLQMAQNFSELAQRLLKEECNGEL
jgi:hypothetical protein